MGGEKEKLLPSPGSRFRCGDMVLWWWLVLGEEGKGTEVGARRLKEKGST